MSHENTGISIPHRIPRRFAKQIRHMMAATFARVDSRNQALDPETRRRFLRIFRPLDGRDICSPEKEYFNVLKKSEEKMKIADSIVAQRVISR